MDNKNRKPNSEDTGWLDEVLSQPSSDNEIGPDEQAVSSAGLINPDEFDLERIIAEVRQSEAEVPAEVPVTEEAATEEIPAAPQWEPTQQFVPVQEETVKVPEVANAAPVNEEEEPELPPRKIRPRPKEGYGLFGIPHAISTVIWALIIIAFGISMGRVVWVCCSDLMGFGKESLETTITITAEDDIDSIADKLNDAGLIRYPGLFKLFAQLTGKDDGITSGTFTLKSTLDYNAMIKSMGPHSTKRDVVQVTFPDGYTCAQIFKLLEEKGVCTAAQLEEYAANGELDDYWFLEGVTRGSKYCLEGYLAPDTYDFYTNDDPRRVLEKFLDELDDRLGTEKIQQQFEDLQEWYAQKLAAYGYSASYIEENKLTIHRVLTLASIVEKETASAEESYNIASVFYNRLISPNFPNLGSDATVHYAIGDYFYEKKELTAEDLKIESDYNTRESNGLPPGAICNAGVYSLYSVLDPEETGYYYFILNPNTKRHEFSKTYSEHRDKMDKLGY